jgi:hypothetical protein
MLIMWKRSSPFAVGSPAIACWGADGAQYVSVIRVTWFGIYTNNGMCFDRKGRAVGEAYRSYELRAVTDEVGQARLIAALFFRTRMTVQRLLTANLDDPYRQLTAVAGYVTRAAMSVGMIRRGQVPPVDEEDART